jgi:hypothetical protein
MIKSSDARDYAILLSALLGVITLCGCATTDGSAVTSHSRSGSEQTARPLQLQARGPMNGDDALVGKRCRVRFRRDALGMAAQAYVDPAADAIGGKALFVEGVVESLGPDAILLRGDGGKVSWIPMGNVLLIDTLSAK